MNDFIRLMVSRRTIRRYKTEQITEDELSAILEAGLHAPNAGGRQSAIIVVSQNAELNDELGKLNRNSEMERRNGNNAKMKKPEMGTVSTEQPSIIDDENIQSAFYGAPTVLTLFAPKGLYNLTGDCFVAAQNTVIAAASLGIGSCIVARASETFATGRGREIQKVWGISDEYEARVHVTLGYPKDNAPTYKARKEDRVIRV